MSLTAEFLLYIFICIYNYIYVEQSNRTPNADKRLVLQVYLDSMYCTYVQCTRRRAVCGQYVCDQQHVCTYTVESPSAQSLESCATCSEHGYSK